jgi:AraC family transcriptional regulator
MLAKPAIAGPAQRRRALMSHAEHIVAGQRVVLALPNPATVGHAMPRVADFAFLSLRRGSSASAPDGTLEQSRRQVPGESASQSALRPLFGISAFADEDTSGEAAIGPGNFRQAKVAPSLVIMLLDRAADALNRDPATAKECIARLCALVRADHDAVRPGGGGLAPWQVQRVKKHIDTVLESTIRARDCAKIARLSTPHFSRSFKISFGETFGDYVARRRTERAQEMMIMTDQPLCEIALCCGFADQSHFSRVYRRRIGSSPGSWRRQRRREPVTHEEPMRVA